MRLSLDSLDDDTLLGVFSALTVPDVLNLRQVRPFQLNPDFFSLVLEILDMS
jgi:hypothetical protein